MPREERILIVRTDDTGTVPLQGCLAGEGFETDLSGTGEGALEMLSSGRYDVLLVEHHPPEVDGYRILHRLKETGKEIPVIILVPFDEKSVASFLRKGAFDVIRKTPDMSFVEKVPHCVEKALGDMRLKAEKREAEDRLARERIISEATLQSVVNGIVYINTHGTIEKTNRTLERLLGKGIVQTGKNICELPEDHLIRKLYLKPLEEGACWEINECGNRECPLYEKRGCLCWTSAVSCSRCGREEGSGRLHRLFQCAVYRTAYEKFYNEPLELEYNGRFLYVYRRNVIGEGGVLIGEILDFIDMTAEKDYRERLRLLSITDHLTGLHNRRYIMDKMEEEFYESRRYDRSLSIMLLDIDDFKRINDTLGHPIGDEVLIQLSVIMESDRRKSDAIGRYGGEEFIVVMPHTARQDAVSMAERLREKISRYKFTVLPSSFPLTVSIGVASLTGTMRNTGDLLKSADTALYTAKARGKNCVEAL